MLTGEISRGARNLGLASGAKEGLSKQGCFLKQTGECKGHASLTVVWSREMSVTHVHIPHIV